MRSTIAFLVTAAAAAFLSGTAAAADFVWPQTGRVTSNFDSARPYGKHAAIDIAGPNRSAITAGRGGRVSFYGVNGGYGNLMIVDHGAGYQTYYAHLTSAARSVGAQVNTGDTIAYEGSTGNSTGPHVHFEVRRYGTKLYVPASMGTTLQRGGGVNYTYAGLSTTQSGGSTPPPSNGGSTQGNHMAYRVSASALNVRSGPGTGNATIGLVHSGEVYISDATQSGWHRVWFNGRQGWSSGQYLAGSGATARIVDVSALNVRTGPSTGYAVVNTIGAGQRYAQTRTSGDWVEIFFDGAKKWIHGGYTHTAGY